MMRIKTNRESGFILVLTLLCALILTSVMLSSMFVSSKGQKVTKNFKESVQTLNAADAAVKQAKGALNTWLAAQQVPALGGSGSEANFTTILTASAAAGELVIPGNATDWGSLTMFGNTVTVTLSNTEGGVASGTTDTDRIIVLHAEAISPTRQRVEIEASIQAPSEGNTAGGMPTIDNAMIMCNDVTGKKQEIKIDKDNILSGHNHTLPAIFPSTTTLYNGAYDVLTANSIAAASLINATKQKVKIDGSASVYGQVGGIAVTGDSAVVTAPSYAGCADLFAFADQVSLLSDSLANVSVITATSVGTGQLGTRDNPQITILNGTTTVSKKKVTKNKVTITSGSHGAGILILQGESEAADTVLVAKKNFYFEGLIIVYGDDKAVLRLKKEEMIYGAALILTGSDDDASKERFIMKKDSRYAYSKAALDNANAAYGRAMGAPAISTATDARNSTITIGWKEIYGF
jgi:Tfp pilus assembly protein PilX